MGDDGGRYMFVELALPVVVLGLALWGIVATIEWLFAHVSIH